MKGLAIFLFFSFYQGKVKAKLLKATWLIPYPNNRAPLTKEAVTLLPRHTQVLGYVTTWLSTLSLFLTSGDQYIAADDPMLNRLHILAASTILMLSLIDLSVLRTVGFVLDRLLLLACCGCNQRHVIRPIFSNFITGYYSILFFTRTWQTTAE